MLKISCQLFFISKTIEAEKPCSCVQSSSFLARSSMKWRHLLSNILPFFYHNNAGIIFLGFFFFCRTRCIKLSELCMTSCYSWPSSINIEVASWFQWKKWKYIVIVLEVCWRLLFCPIGRWFHLSPSDTVWLTSVHPMSFPRCAFCLLINMKTLLAVRVTDKSY